MPRLRLCWLNVVRAIGYGDEQKQIELQQLSRNGVGRVSGIGPTLASIGLLSRPSHDAGNADSDVSLGLTRRGYTVREEDSGFLGFGKDFSAESWATAVTDTDTFVGFCRALRTLLQALQAMLQIGNEKS